MKLYGIVGAGGYGREVMPVAQRMIESMPFFTNDEFVFVVENPLVKQVNGVKVLTPEEFYAHPALTKYFNIAIGDSNTRERISSEFISNGISPFTIKSDNSLIYETADIDIGAVLSPFVTVTANTKIGKFFHANLYSYVAHDCVIGDYVTFAPGVKCNGNVVIENHAYIGAGAVIKQGTAKRPVIIGTGAVVGMGAVVTKSVPAGTTVFGNPAKPLSKKHMAK